MKKGAVTHTMVKGFSRGKFATVHFYFGNSTKVTCGYT